MPGSALIRILICTLVLACCVNAQDPGVQADTARAARPADSLSSAADTDSTHAHRIIKRDFIHREQLLIGTWMMVFVILMIVTTKNYNPN